MTPSASSRWIRFQHGVEDRPTRLPMSATESEASSCRTAKILRSIASIEIFFQLTAFARLYIEKYFKSRGMTIAAKGPAAAISRRVRGENGAAKRCGLTLGQQSL